MKVIKIFFKNYFTGSLLQEKGPLFKKE